MVIATNEEGRTGFRIPTHSFEPGWNDLRLQELACEEPALDSVSAQISGQIGVDIAAAGAALARLAKSPEMAVAMGCLGERRAKEHYDWSIVLQHYSELLDDLQERRQLAKADPDLAPLASHRAIPPLTQIFAAWPSHTIGAHTCIRACGDATDLHHHLQLAMVRIYRRELPPTELIQKTFQYLQDLGSATLKSCTTCPSPAGLLPKPRLPEALGWLLKHGFASRCTMTSPHRYWLALHPDIRKPIGGAKQMHRLAEALMCCGRESIVIQERADFHPGWFESRLHDHWPTGANGVTWIRAPT